VDSASLTKDVNGGDQNLQIGKPATPAPDPSLDMGKLLDQPAGVAPGSRTGDAVTAKEKQQAKRSGTPAKSTGHAGLDAAIAAHNSAPTDRVKSALGVALENSGIDDPAKPGRIAKIHDSYESPQQYDQALGHQLAGAWNHLHDTGSSPEELAHVEQAMAAHGMDKVGEKGDRVAFDGAIHEGPAGSFTGRQHKVVRPGWTMPVDADRDYVVSKAKTEK